MKSTLLLIVPVLALAPAAAAAQSASANTNAQAQVQAQTPQARIDAAIQAAARANVPTSLLESKVAEGQAKGVAAERIATAVESRLEVLIRAAQTLNRADIDATGESHLAVAADALQAGVSQNAIIEITRNAPAERRVVATAILADLVRLGHASDVALARVSGAVTSAATLANLHAEVASQLRLGGLTSTLGANGVVRIR